MKLSVCLIVKNEQEVLARCLNCVKKFADEIIIVDTGSNDNTKSIALKYTPKVYDYKWENDFSKARNYSFSFATCPFIMWLDADDIIDDENIRKINNLKNNLTNQDVVMCKYVLGYDKDNNPTFSYNRERIIKNCNKCKWQGFIHECIAPFGNVVYSDIQIIHNKIKSSNPKRNLKIFQKHKKQGRIFNAREQYYFAKEYFYLSYYSTCIKQIKKFLKMPNKFLPNEIDAKLHLAKCYINLKQYNKGLITLFNMLENYNPTSEIVCEIANVFLLKNNTKNAVYFYESALNIAPDYNCGAFINNNYYYYIPLLQLTYLCFKQGDYNKAKKYHLQAKKLYPNDEKVLYNDKFFDKKKN